MDTRSLVTYGGSSVAVLSPDMVTAVGGLAIALASLGVNIYYKRKHYHLAKEKQEQGGQANGTN